VSACFAERGATFRASGVFESQLPNELKDHSAAVHGAGLLVPLRTELLAASSSGPETALKEVWAGFPPCDFWPGRTSGLPLSGNDRRFGCVTT
jgi:hypothetical protein